MDYVPVPKAGRLWYSKADFFRPFRTVTGATAGENIIPLYDPTLHREAVDEPDLKDLNTALATLVDIFPDVEPETFREMLSNLSESSRVEIVTEQMLKSDAKRTRKTLRKLPSPETTAKRRPRPSAHTALPTADAFRGESYKKAVKQVLYQEFKTLSHSSIKAVMAEQNYSYTQSRPVLQQLAAKSWRFSLSNIWARRSPFVATGEHPNIMMGDTTTDQTTGVRRTGSAQLDQELHDLFVTPALQQRRQEQLATDFALASQLNDTEAKETETLFDCECCYGSVTFEQLAICDDNCHQLCFDCVRRSVNEALYGQGWSQSIDLQKTTLRCFAQADQTCHGRLPGNIIRRALAEPGADEDTWNELQKRMASEALVKSGLRLQRCGLCQYAEVDEVPSLKLRNARGIFTHIVTRSSATLQIMLLFLTAATILITAPLIMIACLVWMIITLVPPVAAITDASWSRVYKQRRGLKFECRNPTCSKISCIRCTATWRDPHVCFESEKTSLRTAIESSATAAVKRTCPRCLLSFVKASGCNKLVCNCGYTMCYICRQEVTSKEGYGHFCQHFRPSGGRCGECERCDLYGAEDEEAAIRKATQTAEKMWREREGGRQGDTHTTQLMVEALISRPRSSTSAPPGQWGPSVGPTSHPGPASIGSGSRDKQLAALRAQKRKDMLMTQDASYADTLGKFKRRLSDEGASLSAPPSENEDRDALVYVHHVQKADTLAGITIKYNCSVATLHKANRMWPNDPVHSRDTLILPVDACGVKGKIMPGSEALDLLSSDADALSAGQAEEVPTPDPQLLNGDAFSRNRTNSSSTNTSRRPSTAALSNGDSGPPWHHDSWVLLPADTKPTEIARLSRRALGYFPPTRRKSNCYSDLDTPCASFDLTRPATNDQQLLAASPSRQDLRPPRPRRLSNANNGYFPAYMAGPGGVGTMNRNVHFPGPAQDGLNKFFAKHLPNVAPPRNHQALLTPEMPLYSDELTPVASGTTSPNLMATNVNLENVGGAIETWMRRMATQAKGAMQNPDRQKAARASVGTPGKGAGGIGDLIEMTDEFEIGDDDDVNESHDDEEHGRGRRESVLHVGTEPTSSAVSYYEDTGTRERSKGGKKGKDD
ncbi:hypothetical protein B0A54_01913 [Friedmanniomyces endolithicus]|uniref:RING-type domain-containing protein n=1 Tax=Friedmanniomyces endolithicus TaxID=329885 RepID=A0A4U0VEM5_9PEZI|nr:hypothetical protein B0A54_01913 [Friedmanniomyces endolithicus]